MRSDIQELLDIPEIAESELYTSWVLKARDVKNGIREEKQQVMYKVANSGEEPSDEDFIDEELVIAALIGAALAKKGKEAEALIIATLSVENIDRFPDAVLQAENIMHDVMGTKLEDRVSKSIDTVITRGSKITGSAGILKGALSKELVDDGILKSTKYYTNAYFNDHVVPVLYKQVDLIMSGETALSQQAFKELGEVLSKRLKNTPYWRVVSNGAMSRGYHYGVFKAAQMNGYRGYSLKAIRDERTSEICKSLDGKTFWLADAINHVERSASAQDAEELKILDPWAKLEDVEGKDSRALRDAGILTPPFHANCRTTVELLN